MCYAKRDPLDENVGYRLNNFPYDVENDVYECPQKQILTHQRNTTRGKMEYKIYQDVSACSVCPVIKKCTSGVCECVLRNVNEKYKERADTIAKENPELYKRRGQIEHVFGICKAVWGNWPINNNVLSLTHLFLLAFFILVSS
jgi:hypothetical protein